VLPKVSSNCTRNHTRKICINCETDKIKNLDKEITNEHNTIIQNDDEGNSTDTLKNIMTYIL
jgi:hypothetical protein